MTDKNNETNGSGIPGAGEAPPPELEAGFGSDDKLVAGGVIDTAPKRYCCGKLSRKQFIWMWVIIAIIMVLIIVAVLLVLFVGGKAIAQSGLNSSIVTIDGLTIGDPVGCGPEVTAQLCLDSTMEISVASKSMSSTILPARNTIFLDGREMGYVQLPEMDVAGHSTSRFTNKGTLFITDRAVFDTFGEDIMLKDEIKMNMKAKMDVKGLGITFKGLNFDKAVTMNGFNNFTNVMGRTISPLQIFQPSPELKKKYWDDVPGVINAQFGYSSVQVPNPTVISIPNVGNITGDLFCEGTQLGVSVALNGTSLVAHGYSYVNNMVVIQVRNETQTKINECVVKMLGGQEVILLLHGTSTTNTIWNPPIRSMYMPTNATLPSS